MKRCQTEAFVWTQTALAVRIEAIQIQVHVWSDYLVDDAFVSWYALGHPFAWFVAYYLVL